MFSFSIVVSGLRQESEMFVFNSILYYLLDEQMRIKKIKKGGKVKEIMKVLQQTRPCGQTNKLELSRSQEQL